MLLRAYMEIFLIDINKLFEWLFQECSPPKGGARVRFPAGTCQSWDLVFRMEMTLVKSLHNVYNNLNSAGGLSRG
jgi:hypothetical protein